MDIIKRILLVLTISLGINAIPNITTKDVHIDTTIVSETVVEEKTPLTATLPGKTISHSDVKTSEVAEKPVTNNTYSRGGTTVEEVEFTLSFYTTLPKENGGHIVTCKGIPLKNLDDAVASNVYPINTEIYLEKFGEVRVLDRGGNDFNSSTRLDVLIQRERKDNGKWEDDDEYERRVNKMGHVKVKGWIKK
jgi:3D (Asp-Asp-Asp) domain-containing protein